MAETIAQNQVLAAKRWMEDEAGMERASLSPAEYVAYRMKVSAADAEALVAAVYVPRGAGLVRQTRISRERGAETPLSATTSRRPIQRVYRTGSRQQR